MPRLRALVGDRAEGPVLAEMPAERNLSRAFRLYLKRAGLKRRDEPLKIKSRAGHSRLGTTEGYIRETGHVTAGFGQVFPKLPPGVVHWSRMGSAADPPREPGARNHFRNPGGEGGIRTRGTLLEYTAFPVRRLRPLGHLSRWKSRPPSVAARAIRSAKSSEILGGEQGIRTLGTFRYT